MPLKRLSNGSAPPLVVPGGPFANFRRWDVRQRLDPWRALSPPQLFVGSFVLLILSGTFGLLTLPGLFEPGREMGPLDALFTVTSAVCVTGLTVDDTATAFTRLGQAYLLLLIQLGGLGVIAFASLIIVAFGRRLSLRQSALTGVEVAPQVNPRNLVRDVVGFTFGIEVVGALALFGVWFPWTGDGVTAAGGVGQTVADVAWHATFHSVSAFCNAGFSTYTTNLIGYQQDPLTLGILSTLIILGGIGFLTLEELAIYRRARRGGRYFRVSLHTRIVLLTTAVLLIGGWAMYTVFEWRQSLADLSAAHKVTNAWFMSVTARTAGFNAIDYADARAGTNFLTIILMSVGGSPGGTAGGLKTTTIALIGLLAWSRFRGHAVTTLFDRSVPDETVQRAVGLFVVAFGTVTAGIFVLASTQLGGQETGGFLTQFFEAVSAFNTVGLSMGATPELTPAGRWTCIVLMFLGRVGPLTFAAALAARHRARPESFRFAYEDVVVG